MRVPANHVIALSCSALLLTSCVGVGGEAEPSPTVTVTETVTATPEVEPESEPTSGGDATETPEDGENVGGIGDAVENHGVELTVNDAYSAESIPMNNSNQSNDSPNAVFDAQAAPDGGKYVVVETTINNIGATSMDLTCSWPIDVVGVDDQDREFDTVDDRYKYEGNPACNDKLQPGFSSDMTYVFAIPEDAELVGMAFRDTERSEFGEYAAVIFDPPLD